MYVSSQNLRACASSAGVSVAAPRSLSIQNGKEALQMKGRKSTFGLGTSLVPTLPQRSRRRGLLRLAPVLFALAFVLGALLPGSASAGWVLNGVQLDNGTCGHNLQIGSDKTMSSSATPWFLLYADGGAAIYDVFIDGT